MILTFRYGWLKKGSDAIRNDPNFFRRDDAYIQLGIGKNMLRSIKHWCIATQLIVEKERKNNLKTSYQPSAICSKLLLDNGWDPYLEDTATLWLIHWLMTSNSSVSTTWSLTFSLYNQIDFTKNSLSEFINGFCINHRINISENTIKRDIDCFIRTYVPSKSNVRIVLEDSFNNPLNELGLITTSSSKDYYRFNIGFKDSLPPLIFGFALIQFMGRIKSGHKTVSFEDCLYGYLSPGQVFKLDEIGLIRVLEELKRMTGSRINFHETSGLKQVFIKETIDELELLERYFNSLLSQLLI